MIAAEHREQRPDFLLTEILCNLSSICSLNRNETSNQSDITEDKTDKVIFKFNVFSFTASAHQYCDCDFRKKILNPDIYSSAQLDPDLECDNLISRE